LIHNQLCEETDTMLHDLSPYANVPDFIYGITREIWEGRGIGKKLDLYYAKDIKLRAATGYTGSNQGVTAQTLQTLHQFPDRQLVGEDVIWQPYADGSFLSSHRLISVMTHTGDGIYGQAQGKAVRSRIIADCWVRDRVVVEEWLVRDQAAFANCMGTSARAMAREMADTELRAGQPISFFTPAQDQPSACPFGIEKDASVAAYVQGLQDIWGSKDTAAIRSQYFHGANMHVPGGDVRYGHADIDRFVVSYLASMPDAKLTVHSAFINRDAEQPLRVAARWSLSGTHTGWGHFGEPTGAPLYVMGLSHAHISQGRVMNEWITFDEVSIWKQIYAHQAKRA
jgi:predicted ester cyclase